VVNTYAFNPVPQQRLFAPRTSPSSFRADHNPDTVVGVQNVVNKLHQEVERILTGSQQWPFTAENVPKLVLAAAWNVINKLRCLRVVVMFLSKTGARQAASAHLPLNFPEQPGCL
jgi:hypothetical protein